MDGEVTYAARPDTLKHLRACRTCKLVKTHEQFMEAFCDNCWQEWADGVAPASLPRAARQDTAVERTTTDFEGLVSMMRPDESWVARWLRMKKAGSDGSAQVSFMPGLYAIALPGEAAGGGEEGYSEDEEEEEEGGGGRAGDAMEEEEGDTGAAEGKDDL